MRAILLVLFTTCWTASAANPIAIPAVVESCPREILKPMLGGGTESPSMAFFELKDEYDRGGASDGRLRTRMEYLIALDELESYLRGGVRRTSMLRKALDQTPEQFMASLADPFDGLDEQSVGSFPLAFKAAMDGGLDPKHFEETDALLSEVQSAAEKVFAAYGVPTEPLEDIFNGKKIRGVEILGSVEGLIELDKVMEDVWGVDPEVRLIFSAGAIFLNDKQLSGGTRAIYLGSWHSVFAPLAFPARLSHSEEIHHELLHAETEKAKRAGKVTPFLFYFVRQNQSDRRVFQSYENAVSGDEMVAHARDALAFAEATRAPGNLGTKYGVYRNVVDSIASLRQLTEQTAQICMSEQDFLSKMTTEDLRSNGMISFPGGYVVQTPTSETRAVNFGVQVKQGSTFDFQNRTLKPVMEMRAVVFFNHETILQRAVELTDQTAAERKIKSAMEQGKGLEVLKDEEQRELLVVLQQQVLTHSKEYLALAEKAWAIMETIGTEGWQDEYVEKLRAIADLYRPYYPHSLPTPAAQ